jgi:hypothetical protein
MNRRNLIAILSAFGFVAPAKAEDAETARLRTALEDIALLDEVDGHELTVNHAFKAVAIATSTLGKHPSQISAERYARGGYSWQHGKKP